MTRAPTSTTGASPRRTGPTSAAASASAGPRDDEDDPRSRHAALEDSTFYGDLFAHVVEGRATSTSRTACTARWATLQQRPYLPRTGPRATNPVSHVVESAASRRHAETGARRSSSSCWWPPGRSVLLRRRVLQPALDSRHVVGHPPRRRHRRGRAALTAGQVTVNVYNATTRAGLAAATPKDVKARGFVIAAGRQRPRQEEDRRSAEVRSGRTARPARTRRQARRGRGPHPGHPRRRVGGPRHRNGFKALAAATTPTVHAGAEPLLTRRSVRPQSDARPSSSEHDRLDRQLVALRPRPMITPVTTAERYEWCRNRSAHGR